MQPPPVPYRPSWYVNETFSLPGSGATLPGDCRPNRQNPTRCGCALRVGTDTTPKGSLGSAATTIARRNPGLAGVDLSRAGRGFLRFAMGPVRNSSLYGKFRAQIRAFRGLRWRKPAVPAGEAGPCAREIWRGRNRLRRTLPLARRPATRRAPPAVVGPPVAGSSGSCGLVRQSAGLDGPGRDQALEFP
jgi:hypothetical protein